MHSHTRRHTNTHTNSVLSQEYNGEKVTFIENVLNNTIICMVSTFVVNLSLISIIKIISCFYFVKLVGEHCRCGYTVHHISKYELGLFGTLPNSRGS